MDTPQYAQGAVWSPKDLPCLRLGKTELMPLSLILCVEYQYTASSQHAVQHDQLHAAAGVAILKSFCLPSKCQYPIPTPWVTLACLLGASQTLVWLAYCHAACGDGAASLHCLASLEEAGGGSSQVLAGAAAKHASTLSIAMR